MNTFLIFKPDKKIYIVVIIHKYSKVSIFEQNGFCILRINYFVFKYGLANTNLTQYGLLNN